MHHKQARRAGTQGAVLLGRPPSLKSPKQPWVSPGKMGLSGKSSLAPFSEDLASYLGLTELRSQFLQYEQPNAFLDVDVWELLGPGGRSGATTKRLQFSFCSAPEMIFTALRLCSAIKAPTCRPITPSLHLFSKFFFLTRDL